MEAQGVHEAYSGPIKVAELEFPDGGRPRGIRVGALHDLG